MALLTRYQIRLFSIADNDWVERTVVTYCYKKGNIDYQLVRIKTLAEAIGRTPNSLVKWEKLGKLPEPRFSIPNLKEGNTHGKTSYRWYSLKQVLMVQKHFETLLNGRKPNSAKSHLAFDHEEFFKRVKADWNIDDRPIEN